MSLGKRVVSSCRWGKNKLLRLGSYYLIIETFMLCQNLEIKKCSLLLQMYRLVSVSVCVFLITFLLSSIALSRSLSCCSHAKRRRAWCMETWTLRYLLLLALDVMIGRISYPCIFVFLPVVLQMHLVFCGAFSEASWCSQKCIVFLFTQTPHWLEPDRQLLSVSARSLSQKVISATQEGRSGKVVWK